MEKSAKTIFFAALEIDDPAQRARLVDAACHGDDALRREIERLLNAHLLNLSHGLQDVMERLNPRLAEHRRRPA
jgi:hypothetical protein